MAIRRLSGWRLRRNWLKPGDFSFAFIRPPNHPAPAFEFMTLKLSTLALVLGVLFAVPQLIGLANPKGFAAWMKKFPRHIPIGIALMALGTGWFLYNLSLESVADFAAFKHYMYLAFAGIGLLTCIFVHDFLAVRGLAVVFLLLAKLMVDTGRPHLGETPWVLVFQAWAYVFVVAGIWFTISPWRLRNWIEWNTANEQRLRFGSGLRFAFCVFMAVLGATVFRQLP
jgi:hypothetical protein